MTQVRITGGVLNVAEAGEIDNSLPGGGQIDNSLPIPSPPPGTWPPPNSTLPIVPAPPGTPPGVIWPSPGLPPHPGHALPGGGHVSGQPVPGGRPDQSLPGQPGTPTPPIASKVYWMLCYCKALGWNFVSVDPSLSVGYPLPGGPPAHASGQPVVPTPTPH